MSTRCSGCHRKLPTPKRVASGPAVLFREAATALAFCGDWGAPMRGRPIAWERARLTVRSTGGEQTRY